MSTGHTLMTIFAMMLLTTVLLNFYKLLNANGDVVNSGQDGIMMATIAASYVEIARGLSFDEITDSSTIAYRDPTKLTAVSKLGTDSPDEDGPYHYNDFDDFNGPTFNGTTIEQQATGTNRKYKISFFVQYVNPQNVQVPSTTKQTFVKRLDIKVWRTFPPGQTDTLRMSSVKGYYTFS